MSQYAQPQIPLSTIPTQRSQPTAVAHLSRVSSGASGHEKIEHRPGGRRRKQELKNDVVHDENEAHLNEMGKLYEKILTYSTGTRYSLYIIPVAIVLMIPVIIGATQVSRTDPKIGGIRVIWFFTWIESVWLTYWAMAFVARIIPLIFGYLAGVVSSETKKYARVLENLQQTITILGWVIISFVLYEVLFSTSARGNTPLGWTTTFKKVMGAILVSTIIFTLEKVFVQFISVNYHARSFNNRIESAKRSVYLICLLFDASRSLFPMYCNEFLEDDYIIHRDIEAFMRKGFGPGHQESSPPDQKRIFKGIGRLSTKVNSVFGNIAAELTSKNTLPPRSAQLIVLEALEKPKSAKALAQRLWLSFVMEGNDVLHLSDLEEVLGGDAREIAKECFSWLDPDDNGDVSLEEITLKVAELRLERKAVARSMHDVSQAIKALDNVLSAVALLLSIFGLISFLDSGFSTVLSTASSALISFSFIFSITAQEFLGSCIFLFVKHPYDIGDRVHISGPDGINSLEVEQISLFYTGFKRVTDLEFIQIPNNILNTLWINNISRSKGMMERVDVFISLDTTFEDIETLRCEMENFVTHEDNKRDFQPDIILRCTGVGNTDKMQLQLEVRHKSNWSVEVLRAARHSKLMCALVLAMRKVPIFGPGGGAAPLGDPANPSYSVTVSDGEASQSRERAAKDADAARLHSATVSNVQDAAGSSGKEVGEKSYMSEAATIDALNTISLSDNILREEDGEDDDINFARDRKPSVEVSTIRSMEMPTSANMDSKKSRSPQGRRRAGTIGPSIRSIMSQQSQAVESLQSRTGTDQFDQEAQAPR